MLEIKDKWPLQNYVKYCVFQKYTNGFKHVSFFYPHNILPHLIFVIFSNDVLVLANSQNIVMWCNNQNYIFVVA
jgi:hypothetical protein